MQIDGPRQQLPNEMRMQMVTVVGDLMFQSLA